MHDLYSRRNRPGPTHLRYDFPLEVRTRLLAVLMSQYKVGKWRKLCEELADDLVRAYGELVVPAYDAARMTDDPAMEHFYWCPPEGVVDFLELAFRRGGHGIVDEVNSVLRQEGIGYRFTEAGHQSPRAIRCDHEMLHQEVAEPALRLLRHPKLAVASAEMLDAYTALREGRDNDAITCAGSAFESLLKTICTEKGWAYNPDKDTCAALIEACRARGLFAGFYADVFKCAGMIRNKIGSAHGRGPTPLYTVGRADAEHLVHLVSAHMLLLAKLAGLN